MFGVIILDTVCLAQMEMNQILDLKHNNGFINTGNKGIDRYDYNIFKVVLEVESLTDQTGSGQTNNVSCASGCLSIATAPKINR